VYAYLSLQLGGDKWYVVSFTLRSLYPRYPFCRNSVVDIVSCKMGTGSLSRVGCSFNYPPLPSAEINPLKPELISICYLLALLGARHFLHVSRIRVKLLTFRRLMSNIYGAPILDVSRSHTTTQHSR